MEELKTLFAHFDAVLDRTLEQLRTENANTTYCLESLVKGAETVAEEIIHIGNTCWERINSADMYYVVHFLWAERAKAFLILWRDIFFEQQKTGVLISGGYLTDEALDRLYRASIETFESAASELKAYPEKEIQAVRRSRGGIVKQIKRWKLMENPWPVYREQIAFLPAQCRCLLDEHFTLQQIEAKFSAIRSLIEQTVDQCEKELDQWEVLAGNTIQYIEDQIEEGGKTKPGKIANRLENLEGELLLSHYQATFNSELEELKNTLPEKMQVSVQIDAGMVQYKEINFRRSIRQWLESEILPVLYEIWELTGDARQSLQMSLVNIRNRAILLATEIKEGRSPDMEKADMSQPLLAYLKKTAVFKSNLKDLRHLVEERLEKEFSLAIVYAGDKDFLPVPLQSTINQLGIGRSVVLNFGQRWLKEVSGRIKQFKTSVEQEESLGDAEKIVRFIKSRTHAPDNQHYTSIFITKGYIGESFWVGRQQEMEHVAALIENWRQGFRGSLLLTGRRFSGKSLFGELIANRHFPKKTIRLAPQSVLRVGGRHMTTGYDLGEALDFVRKYSLNTHSLVWIDDLELWQTPEFPLNQNVRLLRKSIDSFAGQLFFMVSMSNWLKAYLHKYQEFEKAFQSEINLDRMSSEDIRKAILIRHGATHKTLIDDKGREVTPPLFRKMTNRISKLSEGNVGEALNRWSFSTWKVNDEQVRHMHSAGYPLPDFLNPDSALVLSAILLEKRTNEYRLRKLFGPAFTDKYGSIVQRLISLGILIRHPDSWLEVNELVVNHVGKILEKKSYLPG